MGFSFESSQEFKVSCLVTGTLEERKKNHWLSRSRVTAAMSSLPEVIFPSPRPPLLPGSSVSPVRYPPSDSPFPFLVPCITLAYLPVTRHLPAWYLTLGMGPCPPVPVAGGSDSSRSSWKKKPPRRLQGSWPGDGRAMARQRLSPDGSGETGTFWVSLAYHTLPEGQ